MVLSTVVLSIVGGSVNAILVCFAVAPAEFEKNHPDLSDDMRTSWGLMSNHDVV